MLPEMVIHADWGKDPKKRWMVVAQRVGDNYLAGASSPTIDLAMLLDTAVLAGTQTLVGFDFPIGVPLHYGLRTGFANFMQFLDVLATPEWGEFFDLANSAAEISTRRPFYPRTVGGKRHNHLTQAHGAESISDLLRLCERPTAAGRRAACPLFWTLGGNQVGRGALTGWREVLLKYRKPGSSVGMWPFDGDLESLLQSKSLVICETYPAEAYRPLGLVFGKDDSKRRQQTRARFSKSLRSAAERLGVRLVPEALGEIEQGFGGRPDGEDRFDAMVGLLGMVAVLRSGEASVPVIPGVRDWEGWIFGQDASGFSK